MGLFLCKCCGKQLSLDEHICNKEDIEKYVAELENDARIAGYNLRTIQNAVFKLLQTSSALSDSEYTVVETEWLKNLWKAAECQWYESKSSDNFLVCWMSLHRILRKAFDLFRSKTNGKSETLLQKLQSLREACDKAKETLGYQKSNLDMSPEDLIKCNNC